GGDRLPGGAAPLLAAHPVGEGAHPVEHRVHVTGHVLAVHHEAAVGGGAQRGVEHGAVLADVDVLAGEHGLDAPAQPCPLGQPDQQLHGLGGDAVLGVVEVEVAGGQRHAAGPARVVGEQLAQVLARNLAVVLLQRRPLLALGDVAVHVALLAAVEPINAVGRPSSRTRLPGPADSAHGGAESAGRGGSQWDSRPTASPLAPVRKSRSTPLSAWRTCSTYSFSHPRTGRAWPVMTGSRAASSASGMSTSRRRAATSRTMGSPVRTLASGPPAAASGAVCSTTVP